MKHEITLTLKPLVIELCSGKSIEDIRHLLDKCIVEITDQKPKFGTLVVNIEDNFKDFYISRNLEGSKNKYLFLAQILDEIMKTIKSETVFILQDMEICYCSLPDKQKLAFLLQFLRNNDRRIFIKELLIDAPKSMESSGINMEDVHHYLKTQPYLSSLGFSGEADGYEISSADFVKLLDALEFNINKCPAPFFSLEMIGCIIDKTLLDKMKSVLDSGKMKLTFELLQLDSGRGTYLEKEKFCTNFVKLFSHPSLKVVKFKSFQYFNFSPNPNENHQKNRQLLRKLFVTILETVCANQSIHNLSIYELDRRLTTILYKCLTTNISKSEMQELELSLNNCDSIEDDEHNYDPNIGDEDTFIDYNNKLISDFMAALQKSNIKSLSFSDDDMFVNVAKPFLPLLNKLSVLKFNRLLLTGTKELLLNVLTQLQQNDCSNLIELKLINVDESKTELLSLLEKINCHVDQNRKNYEIKLSCQDRFQSSLRNMSFQNMFFKSDYVPQHTTIDSDGFHSLLQEPEKKIQKIN